MVCIFLLFLLDALLVPTLPELFFILAISANTSLEFSLLVLLVGFAGETVGIFFLYSVVKRTGLPKRVDKALKKYINFLIVSDEKVMLINRVAPMIPFAGAVMAAMRKRWDIRKCLLWLVVGYVFKYGLIMLFGQTATTFFDGGTSRTVMLVAIIAMIVISAVVAFLRKKKMGIDQQEVEE